MSDKHEKSYSVFAIAFNLTLACFISGVIIAIVYFITNPVAQKNNEIVKEQSMKELVKEASNFKAIKNKTEWYEAEKNNKAIGYIVQTESNGYGGPIKMLVAVDENCKVIDYTVLSNNETPGLGSKTLESKFKNQFDGKTINHLVVVKDSSDKDDIQAITGATISSRAVTNGVKEAVQEVKQYIGGK